MSDVDLTLKEVKCRKQHRCDWCPEPIKKGEQAIYRTGLYDGNWFSVYYHPECERALVNTDRCLMDYGYEPHDQKRGVVME